MGEIELRGDIGIAIGGRFVTHHLGIATHQGAVGEHHQWIDLDGHAVLRGRKPDELPCERDHAFADLGILLDILQHAAQPMRAELAQYTERIADRRRAGLHIHATLRRVEHNEATGAAVDRHR